MTDDAPLKPVTETLTYELPRQTIIRRLGLDADFQIVGVRLTGDTVEILMHRGQSVNIYQAITTQGGVS